MEKPSQNTLKTSLTLLMICIIGFMVYNQASYIHTHHVAGGKSISHAHPFNKQSDNTPVKNHHHTTFDFASIQQMGHLLFVVIAFFITLFSVKKTEYNTFESQLSPTPQLLCSSGRAPPKS